MEANTLRLEAIAVGLEALGVEANTLRLEAIAVGLEAMDLQVAICFLCAGRVSCRKSRQLQTLGV